MKVNNKSKGGAGVPVYHSKGPKVENDQCSLNCFTHGLVYTKQNEI